MNKRLYDALSGLSRPAALLLSLVLLWVVWRLDARKGPEINFSIFYLIPIGLAVWRGGGGWGVLASALSIAAWFQADVSRRARVYAHWETPYWNAAIRFCFYMMVVRLMVLNKNYRSEQSAKETAEEVSRLKSKMLLLVSHEYNNALGCMKLALTLLKESGPMVAPKVREHCHAVMEAAIAHLSVSTNNFLDLNRLESGQLALNIGRTRIRALARETLSRLEPIIESKRIKIELDMPASPVPVRADAEALSIVLSNLIVNAVKYTPEQGTIAVRVIREESRPDSVLVSIEDTGIGISNEDQKRIFEGFYRAQRGKELAAGYGVGLKLAQELLESHGSRLELVSEPGRGSRFFFRLARWGPDGGDALPKPVPPARRHSSVGGIVKA